MSTQIQKQQPKKVVLTAAEELTYSAEILNELLQMAQARRDSIRAYFLEMAYIETCDQLRRVHASSKRRGHLAA
ncbi:hypothetical protein [Mesorhizobium sp. CAU 1732]|uniref:hypothetical protein n=1 Tax=Mesorhizobium sp. CAU 1732 TaxID=3140358 RepID=UPI003261459C